MPGSHRHVGRRIARIAETYHPAVINRLEPRYLLAVDVTLDAGTRFQTIDGFGTMAPAYSAANVQMYYQDLGASIVRLQLNARALRAPGDNQYATPVTPVTLGPDLQQNIAKFNFNAERVGGPLSVVRDSKTLAPGTKVIASIWSPPHWMKGPELNWSGGYVDTNPNQAGIQYRQPNINYFGNDSSGGSLIDTDANLTQFARYVAAFVKGAEQHTGVPIDAISIQNELAFWEPYDSAVYTPQLYVKALKYVSAEFDRWGITTKLQGPEDVGVGSPSDPWVLWRQFEYIKAIRADSTAMAALDIYSIHGYANDGIGANRSPEMWRQYWDGRPQAQYPNPAGAWWTGIKNDGKPTWMTETSGEPHTWDGAMTVGLNAMDALNFGQVNAWVYWQSSDGGSTPSAQTLTAGADTSPKKYNAAKHFFKHIRPGAQRIAATPSNPNGVYVSAYVHDQQKTATVVLINNSSAAETVNLSKAGTDLNGLSSFNVARRTTASETWTSFGPVTFTAAGVATLSLPARSIVTLQGGLTTVTPPPPPPVVNIQPAVSQLTIPEGTTRTLGIRLSAQPTANVVVNVARAAGDTSITVSNGASLMFTPANWNTIQNVTLAAAQDADVANGAATIRLSATGLANVDVTANEQDDDALAILPAVAQLSIPEGTTRTLGVRLTAQPAANVVVNVARAAGDANITVAGGASLTFTPANWNVLQNVTLSAAQDTDTTNGSATVRLSATGLANADVTVTEQDDDTTTPPPPPPPPPVVAIQPASRQLAVTEGTSKSLGVKLTAQPTANVVVNVARVAGDASLSVQSGGSLTFTPANWNTAQTVTFAAAQDADTDNGVSTMRLSAAGLANVDVTVGEADDDVPLPTPSDTTPPTVVGRAFIFNGRHRIHVRFSENVGPSVDPSDLTLQSVNPMRPPVKPTVVTYNAKSNTAVFWFKQKVFADGVYRATLAAGSVRDASGNELAAPAYVDFFMLAGDFNRDKRVDKFDQAILRQNMNKTNMLFKDGDMDGDGDVDNTDRTAFFARFGRSLIKPTG